MGEALLPTLLSLPVYGSDPLSSRGWAITESLPVLSVGGFSLIHPAQWVAAGALPIDC